MGKLKHGIIGPVSGKVGNIIGSSWNGIHYIRSRPKKRDAPFSENQLKCQFIFSMTQLWLKPLTEYLQVGFRNYSRTVYGLTAAKSMLYKHGLVRDGFNSTVDPTQVLISYGRYPIGSYIEMHFDRETSEICLSWNSNWRERPHFASSDDQLMAVAYNVEAAEVYGQLYGECRSEGRQRFEIPTRTPATFHVYAAFVRADRKEQTRSEYLGAVVID